MVKRNDEQLADNYRAMYIRSVLMNSLWSSEKLADYL